MIKPRVKAPVVSLRILPSAMTVAAICLGLSAVKMALDNRPTDRADSQGDVAHG